MSHTERRIREKEEIRQKILDAARKIATAEGWHSVTIRKIAETIEYTPPIVYEYFDSKENLFQELVYSGFHIIHQQVEKIKGIESNSKKLLLNLSLIYWDFAASNMDLFQLMFSLERPVPSDEMIKIFKLTESIFLDLTHNERQLTEELLLNWVCLNQGAISIMQRFPAPPHFINRDQREMYSHMIQRFIDGLS